MILEENSLGIGKPEVNVPKKQKHRMSRSREDRMA
jgi:hypothetical protein